MFAPVAFSLYIVEAVLHREQVLFGLAVFIFLLTVIQGWNLRNRLK